MVGKQNVLPKVARDGVEVGVAGLVRLPLLHSIVVPNRNLPLLDSRKSIGLELGWARCSNAANKRSGERHVRVGHLDVYRALKGIEGGLG